MSDGTTQSRKQPYQKPRLTVYGDIRDITQLVNVANGNPDGGGFPPFLIFKTRVGG